MAARVDEFKGASFQCLSEHHAATAKLNAECSFRISRVVHVSHALCL